MRGTGLFWVAITTIGIVIGACSGPEGQTSSSEQREGTAAVGTGGAGANVRGDGEFVHDVALKNMAQVELSRMAVNKATSADIRIFAQKIIDDHAAAGNQLKSVVSGHSIDWPAQLDDKHKKTAGELAGKQGADFDREYLAAMVEGHQDLAAKLESRLDVRLLADWKTAAAGRTQTKAMPDPGSEMTDVPVLPATSGNEVATKINQWAADTYPIAQKHLDTARRLENAGKKRFTN